VVVDEVVVPDEVAADPDSYIETGEEHHDELDVTRSQMFWRRKIRKKFKRKDDRNRPPIIAPAPLPSIPGTRCAPGLAARIVVDKYEDHLPHYRQSRRFRRADRVDLGRQTINAWTHATAGHLMPIGLAIRREVVSGDKLQADETPLEYLNPGHGTTSRGYLWAYHAPGKGGCFFDWQLGRGHECILEALGYDEISGTITYQGTIQCDGYSAYQTLAGRFEGLRLAGCLAHIRRKFVEAMPQAPETVLPVLLLIQRIYLVEKQLRLSHAPPACRELVRAARSRPLAEELHQLLTEHRRQHLPHGAVGEAVTYALNQWQKFLMCLEDGALDVDNNLVENQIRPAKLGAKNWLFLGSAEAGQTAALFYTLLANCRIHDLDPEFYLAQVIRRLPHDATIEQAAELTPARFAAALKAGESAA
jgi:transposase